MEFPVLAATKYCVSKRVRQGEVGGLNERVRTEWLCLGLAVKSPQSDPDGPFLLF